MATTYAGDPTNYPTSITIPSDGDGPGISAADVNSAFEGLADRTARLTERHDTAAVNFAAAVVATNATQTRYVHGRREWLAWDFGTNNALYVTRDPFTTWSSTDLLTDATYNALPTCDADGDASGNRLVLFDTIDAASSFDGATWTNIGGTVFGDDPDRPAVAWEPVSGNWIAASKHSTPAAPALASSSTNRTVWTTRINPFPADTYCTISVDRLGTAVLAGFNGTNLYMSRSTDGGVTWSSMATLALGFTAQREGLYWLRPVWSGERWYIAATNITSTDTRIYASDDGLSWSLVLALTSWGFKSFTAIGRTLVALAVQTTGDAPTHLVSVDRGATWKVSDRQITTQHHNVVSNGSRLVIVGGSSAWPSTLAGGIDTWSDAT